jgi:hypothetical protein
MRDLLPPILADFLRDRYIAGVAMAEASFEEGSADEDGLRESRVLIEQKRWGLCRNKLARTA